MSQHATQESLQTCCDSIDYRILYEQAEKLLQETLINHQETLENLRRLTEMTEATHKNNHDLRIRNANLRSIISVKEEKIQELDRRLSELHFSYINRPKLDCYK